jgi:hypothetical protein
MRVAGLVILVILVAVALTLVVARVRWRSVTSDLVAQLSDSSMEMVSAAILPAEIDSLPVPVARYLGAVLGSDPRQIASVRVLWTGEFAQRPGVGEWKPLRAEQVFHTRPPGFVWDARMSLGPGLDVLVRDAFVCGGGSVRGAIHGLVPVVDVHGTPEISAGALQRYLGEAVWFPAALLPRNGVCWESLSDSSARASLTVGETSVTCDFRFGADGLVERVYVPSRFRDVDGTPVPTPWEALVSKYEERDGVLVPSGGEAAWLLPDGRFPYWRGEVASLEYSYGEE